VDSAGVVAIETGSACGCTPATEDNTFIAYSVTDPTGAMPIEAGEPVRFRSSRTGRWCRLGAVSGGQGLVCDQATVDGATELLYTGYSLEVTGQELVSNGISLLLDQGGANTETGDSGLVFISTGGHHYSSSALNSPISIVYQHRPFPSCICCRAHFPTSFLFPAFPTRWVPWHS
jgi:hypothetical protein